MGFHGAIRNTLRMITMHVLLVVLVIKPSGIFGVSEASKLKEF